MSERIAMDETTDHPFELIAEVGQAHEGSLGTAHAYIDAIARTGIGVIKFQVHIADAESSDYESFRVPFSYEDKSRRDYWRRMEFTREQWLGLKRHAESVGLEFLASPFSVAAVELLESINVLRYKIGSGDTANFLMIDRICRTGKPLIISTGLSSFLDLDDVVRFISKRTSSYSIMQCTTKYPTMPEDLGLNVIRELKARYAVPIGFSDHSGSIFGLPLAVSHGAEFVEFHVVFDKRCFGPDATSSIEVRKLPVLLEGVRFARQAILAPRDKSKLADDATALTRTFGRSLSASKELPAGHILQVSDLEAKKPAGFGVPSKDFEMIIGRPLIRSLDRWEFIQLTDLSEISS